MQQTTKQDSKANKINQILIFKEHHELKYKKKESTKIIKVQQKKYSIKEKGNMPVTRQ